MFYFSRINWRLPLKLRQRLFTESASEIEVENSIPLRLGVIALVVVGIIATDIATETASSFWAAPLSLIGAIWSYYRRQSRNIFVKFCIAIGMLLALGAFFSHLVGQLNDTRLALAELLIQLQVLHSFDMPRRKNLGYSIAIGVILLSVAATLSQTLTFAPILLLFLGFALPTLFLAYRSRLGLNEFKATIEKEKHKLYPTFNFKFLILNFLLIVFLGLTIFAILPRFPGYHLRTFPVSAPIEVKNSFSGRSIINPGYVRQGNGKNQRQNANGSDNGEGSQPGKLDNTFYYGFGSQINQNLRGEMIPKVVMRVRSQVEGFWRVIAFDKYTGQGWKISRNEQTQTIKRPEYSYHIFLNNPGIQGNTKEIIQTYTVVSELPNLIPAMTYPKEIYFPTPSIAIDPEGTLRAPVGLSEGVTYTVISEVPYRDRSLLQKTGNQYPEKIKKYYLQIPSSIEEKVRKRTEEIIANYNQDRVGKSIKTLDSPYEIALYLAQYLKQNYTIPKNPQDLPHLLEKEDLVESFLFKNRGGYPDHFSTALTVMLRSIGIPARLVAGFAPGQFNPFTGMYLVQNTDAYAMTEVYFPNYGWFTFDPIPGHPLIPNSIEENQTFGVLRQFWNWVAGWLPSPVTGLLNNLFTIIFGTIAKIISWFLNLFFQGWLGILTGLITGVATAFGGWFVWDKWRQWRRYRITRKLPPMESLYLQMLQWLAAKGFRKHPSQTTLEYAKFSYQNHPVAIAEVIDEISQAYVSWRYGNRSPDLPHLQQRWLKLKKM
jgi:transglutaminase-like putative cysteine protease